MKIAIEEAYENAEPYVVDLDSMIGVGVTIINGEEQYNIHIGKEYLKFTSFSDFKSCEFVKDRRDEFAELITKCDLKKYRVVSYVDTNGKIVSLERDPHLEFFVNEPVYAPDNWDDILEYCRKLDAFMRE